MSTNVTNYPFDAVFDRMLGLTRSASPRPQLWLPAVDTYETEDAFVVEADLPGVAQDAIDVHFEQSTLTISGQRAPARPEKLRMFAAERLSGTFSRAVRLPEYVDGAKISATFTNGVLTVTIPKASGALPRKIEIGTGA